MSFTRKILWCCCGSFLFGFLTLNAYAAKGQKKMPTPLVTTAGVTKSQFVLELEYAARTAGYREIQVRAQVSGILKERTYEEGAQVKEGQIMFHIDPRTYQAALASAKGRLAQEQARYRQTQRDLRRIRELETKGYASESELDGAVSDFEQSKANVQAAKADVQTKQIDLEYTTVKAPITGVTSQETVSEGSLMVSGDPNASLLTRITQLDPMYVNFSAPNKDVNYIRDGLKKGLIVNDNQKLKVSIILSDGSVYPMPGNVNFTDSLIDTATGSVNARAVVPNKKLKLLPGQFVRVKVEGLYLPDAITVPERSISQGPKGTFVYVVDDKNIAHQRKVNVGYTSNNRWLVTSGLKEGEQIIVEGVSKTRPETPVRIAPKDPIPNAAPGATTATKTNLKNSK